MPTTITKLGNNAQAISYTAGATRTELLSALNTVLTQQGWTLFDANVVVNGGEAVAQCFRAPMADAAGGFKYMVLHLTPDAAPTSMMVKVYETWNAATHAGTNVCYQSDTTTYAQRLSLSQGGLIYVFATARYAAFYARTALAAYGEINYSSFTGCFEIARDNADEVPGAYPLFGWGTGSCMIGQMAATTPAYHCFALPRTRGGATGVNASLYQSISTLIGRTAVYNNALLALYMQLPTAVNPISTNGNNFAFTPYSVEVAAGTNAAPANIRGRIYGPKLLARNVGVIGDTINLKVDSDLMMDNGQNSPIVPHMIVGENYSSCRFAFPL